MTLRDTLTKRGQEVALLLGQGDTNREIAKSLGISVKTVDTHRAHMSQQREARALPDPRAKDDTVMPSVRATAVCWISDEPQPGWIEVRLLLASGLSAALFDKPPIFGIDARFEGSVPIAIDCDVVEDHGDSAVIELHNGIKDEHGNARFEVSASMLIR